jgi:hypothetical protein
LGCLMTNWNQALMSQNDWQIHLSCRWIKIGLQGLSTNDNCYWYSVLESTKYELYWSVVSCYSE